MHRDLAEVVSAGEADLTGEVLSEEKVSAALTITHLTARTEITETAVLINQMTEILIKGIPILITAETSTNRIIISVITETHTIM